MSIRKVGRFHDFILGMVSNHEDFFVAKIGDKTENLGHVLGKVGRHHFKKLIS